MNKQSFFITAVLIIITIGSAAQTGTFTDSRDGKTYKTVKIGTKTWMAENLAYKPDSGNFRVYNNNEVNAKINGYLYEWETAKYVCPVGWHLPSKSDFEALIKFYGNGTNAYKALIKDGKNGFSALLSGWSQSTNSFGYMNKYGVLWSSSPSTSGSVGNITWDPSKIGNIYAWILIMSADDMDAYLKENFTGLALSVRCLKK